MGLLGVGGSDTRIVFPANFNSPYSLIAHIVRARAQSRSPGALEEAGRYMDPVCPSFIIINVTIAIFNSLDTLRSDYQRYLHNS